MQRYRAPGNETLIEGARPRPQGKEVKIRVWEGNPGHVSLETSDIYMSFWPSEVVELPRLLSPVTGKFHTLEEDRQIERKAPEHIFTLTLPMVDLAQLMISMKVMLLEIDKLNWRITSNGGALPEGRQFNCASLVYRFLSNAGIETRINRRQFGRLHQLFLLITALIAIAGGIILSKTSEKTIGAVLLGVGLALFLLKYCDACYVRCSSYHPVIFERIPVTPIRIKKLVESAKPQKVESDNSIAAYPVLQVKPKEISEIDPSYIRDLIRNAVEFQYLALDFFRSSTEDEILGEITQLYSACQLFLQNNSIESHIENAVTSVRLTGGILLTVMKPYNLSSFTQLNSAQMHRFPRSRRELNNFTELTRSTDSLRVNEFFDRVFDSNLFIFVYQRFPFTERTINRLKINVIDGISDTEDFYTYAIKGIKLTSIFLLLVVLQSDLLRLKYALQDRRDDVLLKNYTSSTSAFFPTPTAETDLESGSAPSPRNRLTRK